MKLGSHQPAMHCSLSLRNTTLSFGETYREKHADPALIPSLFIRSWWPISQTPNCMRTTSTPSDRINMFRWTLTSTSENKSMKCPTETEPHIYIYIHIDLMQSSGLIRKPHAHPGFYKDSQRAPLDRNQPLRWASVPFPCYSSVPRPPKLLPSFFRRTHFENVMIHIYIYICTYTHLIVLG